MQTSIMYAPGHPLDPQPFVVRSGRTGQVSTFVSESVLRVIGDGDINTTIERAKATMNTWVTLPAPRNNLFYRPGRYTAVAQ